jgi:Xaa-Pro aminopeptidase
MDMSFFPDWPGRLRRVQTALDAHQIGALIVSNRTNILYLTGFSGSAGLLLVTRDEIRLLLDGRYELVARQAVEAGRLAPVAVGRVEGRYDQALAQTVTWFAPRRIGFEAAQVTVATLRAWQRLASAPEWVPTDNVVERLREVKDPYEIGVLRRGGTLISDVARQLAGIVRPGRSELDVADRIDRAIRQAGFSRPAFETIVASGPNSAHPHAHPGDRTLSRGDLVVLDFGGILDGYCVDLTRMAAVGSISPDADALFDAVSAAHGAAVESVRPSVETWQVDRAARAVLEARGLGDAFLHSTGHGLGLEVHEAPRVGRVDPEAPATLEVGMVFTIEPGAYLEHVGGARVEDDVLVTESGAELLTTAPRELIAV